MIVNEPILVSTLLVALDLGGTFVFALSGAAAGVKYKLDLFGVLFLSFVAGNSGGIARDVMIGALPPVAMSDWRYMAVSILAGSVTFCCYGITNRISSPVLVFDAAGLALFTVSGAGKALTFRAGPVAAYRNRRRHGARCPRAGDSHRVAQRALRDRCPDWCGCGGNWKDVAFPVCRGRPQSAQSCALGSG